METKLTEQESLAIINEMIDRARNNVQKGVTNNMIYNGYAVAFIAILNFILLHLLPEAYINWSYSVWWLMIPSMVIDSFLKKRIDNSKIVRTQIDSIITTLWEGYVISVIVLLIIIFSMTFIYDTWHFSAMITPITIVMTALIEFGMAKACRFKPFLWGAIVFWTGALLCCLFTYIILRRPDIQFLILAVCMILGFVIPGHQLNKLAKKDDIQGT